MNYFGKRKEESKMSKLILAILLVLVLVMSIVLVSGCSDNKPTGYGDFERPPFTPDEGEGWPSTELLSHFGLGDWSRPIGIDGVIYIAYPDEYRYLNTVVYRDNLIIEFETSTQQTYTLIRSYLQRTFPFIQYIWDSATYSWKLHSNSVIVVYTTVSGSGDRIQVIRDTSNAFSQGWIRANDLAIFDVRDFTQPSGIEYQYNFIVSNNDRYMLTGRFTGELEHILTYFRNYFMPRATLIDDAGHLILFRKVVGNTYYDYRVWTGVGNGIFDFYRFTSYFPPGPGTGWPTSDMLNPFKLDDWVMPVGLQGLTWESAALDFWHTRLIINFTQATEASVDTMRNYLNSKASGSLDHQGGDGYRGYFRSSDGEYYYSYNVNFSLSRGGRILLERKCISY